MHLCIHGEKNKYFIWHSALLVLSLSTFIDACINLDPDQQGHDPRDPMIHPKAVPLQSNCILLKQPEKETMQYMQFQY